LNIGVVGAGSWGTSLANMLCSKDYNVVLWVREKELLDIMILKRENTWFLPGIKLDSRLKFSNSFEEVVRNKNFLVFVIPSQYTRGVLLDIKPFLSKNVIVVCASKGIELNTLKTMSEVFFEVLGDLNPIYAHLSGPSFAKEVALCQPTAVSLGCTDEEKAKILQQAFSTDYFRVYINPDVKGVELGGAIKNVIAIAAGICDGLNLGYNARAALITRGLAEMARLGIKLGAKKETFMGLSGLGDLVLTCTGELSRNRQVGLRIGRGEKLKDIVNSMKMVAEGVKTAEALYKLAKKIGVDLPITEQVYKILYEDKDPTQATIELMVRELKCEF